MTVLALPKPFFVIDQKHCGHVVFRTYDRPTAVALKSDLHLDGLHAFRVRRGVEGERRAPLLGDESCDSCVLGRDALKAIGAR